MKTIISTILIALIVVGIYSCDKVKNPVITKAVAVGTTFDTVTNATVANFKKILLEDYTGHKCVNCPAAAILAETLHNQYKDTLVIIAVHAGWFSRTDTELPTSYTCQAGNDWDGPPPGFNVSATSNPNGMVNRKVYPGFTLVHKDTWASTVALAKKDTFFVKLNLTSRYDPTARALNVDSKLTFLKAYPRNVMLSLVLTEDGIVGEQLDNTKTPNLVEDYEFDHMLRDAVNTSWGELAKAGPMVVGDTAVVKRSNFAVLSKFNDQKVSLVAFVYDATTKQVLQVEKIKIRK